MHIGWAFLVALVVLSGCVGPQSGGEDEQAPDEGAMTWSWRQAAAPSVARGEAACASDGENRILLAGGLVPPPLGLPTGYDGSRSVEVYEGDEDRWSQAPDLPVAVHHTAIAYAQDRYWLAGGYPGPTFTPSDMLISWGPGDATWTIHDRMPVARGAHGMAAVANTLILVGGVTADGVTARTDAYNTTSGEWSRLRDAPTSREHLAVDAIGDVVYVAAGRSGQFDSEITRFEMYNTTTDTWSQGPRLPTPRGGAGGTGGVNGFIVVGGEGTDKTFREVERYDPGQDAWESLPDDPDPRHGLCVATLGEAVHVITGGHSAGFAVSDTHNVLAPEEGA